MTDIRCNLCNGTRFADVNGRVNVKCVGCGSMERTRLLKMFLDKVPLDASSKVLHLAPERGLYAYLKKVIAPDNYVVADFEPTGFGFAPDCRPIDLCDLGDRPSDAFDLIIHSHVLEHTPCNIAYTLFHLDRMMRDGGMQLCVIPFMPGRWDESFQDMAEPDRVRRFGQNDHVRRYGAEDYARHLGCVIRLDPDFDAGASFSDEMLTRHAIPESQRRGLHGSTVLKIKKGDYLLSC